MPRATSCIVGGSLVDIFIQSLLPIEGEALGEQLEFVEWERSPGRAVILRMNLAQPVNERRRLHRVIGLGLEHHAHLVEGSVQAWPVTALARAVFFVPRQQRGLEGLALDRLGLGLDAVGRPSLPLPTENSRRPLRPTPVEVERLLRRIDPEPHDACVWQIGGRECPRTELNLIEMQAPVAESLKLEPNLTSVDQDDGRPLTIDILERPSEEMLMPEAVLR